MNARAHMLRKKRAGFNELLDQSQMSHKENFICQDSKMNHWIISFLTVILTKLGKTLEQCEINTHSLTEKLQTFNTHQTCLACNGI